TGEYGSISADITHYSNKWNDPTLTGLAHSLQGLPFQPFPANAGRLLQFKYQYPFCTGCITGSTVPQQFSYGHVTNMLPVQAVKTSVVSPANKPVTPAPAPANTPIKVKVQPNLISKP